MLNTNYATRVLNLQEIEAMRVLAKDENSTRTVLDHIANGKMKTRYVSTSKDVELSSRKYIRDKKSNVVAEYIAIFKIDLIKNKIYDFTNIKSLDSKTLTESTMKYQSEDKKKKVSDKAFSYACTDSELIIDGTPNEDSYVIVSADDFVRFYNRNKLYMKNKVDAMNIIGDYFFSNQH